MRSLGLGNEIPATAFFDGDGKLVARVLGELDKPELEHRIEWMPASITARNRRRS
jgi:hypothetical protein